MEVLLVLQGWLQALRETDLSWNTELKFVVEWRWLLIQGDGNLTISTENSYVPVLAVWLPSYEGPEMPLLGSLYIDSANRPCALAFNFRTDLPCPSQFFFAVLCYDFWRRKCLCVQKQFQIRKYITYLIIIIIIIIIIIHKPKLSSNYYSSLN
jgi:hypothetical protein